jgi:hypothetical protein
MGTGRGTGNLVGTVRGKGAKLGFGGGRGGDIGLLVGRVGSTGNRFVGGIVKEVGSNDGASEGFRVGLRVGLRVGRAVASQRVATTDLDAGDRAGARTRTLLLSTWLGIRSLFITAKDTAFLDNCTVSTTSSWPSTTSGSKPRKEERRKRTMSIACLRVAHHLQLTGGVGLFTTTPQVHTCERSVVANLFSASSLGRLRHYLSYLELLLHNHSYSDGRFACAAL